jgi:hypothetical protein
MKLLVKKKVLLALKKPDKNQYKEDTIIRGLITNIALG